MTNTASNASSLPPALFPPTRWSVVAAAARATESETGNATGSAIEELCRVYWYPLYAYVRRRGGTREDAEDLTQEFFRQLLARRWLADADRDKGRLRTFLLVALKRFMAKEWRRAGAQKRGGGQAQVPMDTAFAESRWAADPNPGLTPEAVFDRQWALTLLDLSLRRLEAEYASQGKADEFARLKGCLTAAQGTMDYAALASELGLSEGATRVAVHRLRKRFRELYREEIRQTLPPNADLDEELRHLAACLAQP
jgi:RNA polymerase sigma-70 factor (ECF subfamily)